MRRLGPALILALILGGLLGGLMARDPGYVLVVYEETSFETSLWAALLLLLLLYGLVRGVLRVIGWSTRAGPQLRQWESRRRQRRARRLLERGLMLEAEGRWRESKQALLRAVEDSDSPVLHYLHAARAAHELGQLGERDRLLERALEASPGSGFTVQLTRAGLDLGEHQHERALSTLLELRRRAPKHPALLRMLAESYRHLADWPALLALVPELRRHRVLAEEQILALLEEAWQERLRQLLAEGGEGAASSLEAAWRELPRDYRKDPRLVLPHARALNAVGAVSQCEKLLRETIEGQWNQRLVALYGELHIGEEDHALRERRRKTAEHWLEQHGDDAVLRLTLGRIHLSEAEPDKARDHLEAALRSEPSSEVHAALGELYRHLGEYRVSAEHFARAVTVRADGEPEQQRAPLRLTNGPAEGRS